jgi:hypothetical protein
VFAGSDVDHRHSSHRVRWRATVPVAIASSEPSTAGARMIQTSEARVEDGVRSRVAEPGVNSEVDMLHLLVCGQSALAGEGGLRKNTGAAHFNHARCV